MIDPKYIFASTGNLHKNVADVLSPFIETLQSSKFDDGSILVPLWGFRSFSEQDKIYEIGRSVFGNVVTNRKGGTSYHNYGMAVDLALWKSTNGGLGFCSPAQPDIHICWEWMEALLPEYPEIEWGGHFKLKDRPHIQVSFGISMPELQRAYESEGFFGTNKLIDLRGHNGIE